MEALKPARLLAAYDAQLRTDAEAANAFSVDRLGPLWLITLQERTGFITYQDLAGVSAAQISKLVADAVAHFSASPNISEIEWKTRAHDHAPGLHAALIDNGFVAEATESIMLGEARDLLVEVALPSSVSVRAITEPEDVQRMVAMQDAVFGRVTSVAGRQALLDRLALQDGAEFWVAEAGGEVISSGRLEPVRGSDFAGIWGGATLEQWRGRGIYRALTSARAHSALRQGKRFINSDSTEFSRPILERSGLIKVSSTTPYRWHR